MDEKIRKIREIELSRPSLRKDRIDKIACGGKICRIEMLYPANLAAAGDLVYPVLFERYSRV